MMKLELTNEKLSTVCDRFSFSNPQFDPVELSNSMTLYREKLNGVGLAANQVGLSVRVISVKGFDSALFNPIIVDQSEEQEILEEGCLSFKGLVVKIKRPSIIRLRFSDAFGKTSTKVFKGLTARILQHEIDHLDGVLFYNRASQYHRDKALKKWRRTNGN